MQELIMLVGCQWVSLCAGSMLFAAVCKEWHHCDMSVRGRASFLWATQAVLRVIFGYRMAQDGS
jgi:hypothetical protein